MFVHERKYINNKQTQSLIIFKVDRHSKDRKKLPTRRTGAANFEDRSEQKQDWNDKENYDTYGETSK